MPKYEKTNTGFLIRISLYLYARAAVIKALYTYRDRYLIYYELNNDELIIFFEPIHSDVPDMKTEISNIYRDLDFQMLRYDTMKNSKEIRELLVGRALYATCIEPDHEVLDSAGAELNDSWEEDGQRLFSSWSSELTE